MKVVIKYNPDMGSAVPDGFVEEIYQDELKKINMLKEKGDITWFTNRFTRGFSTENIILRFRVGRREKDFEELSIEFEDTVIDVDQDGRITYWPEGFCDTFEKLLGRLFRDASS